MNRLLLIALCALTAYVTTAQTNGFTTGSSFEADEETRFSLRLKFVARSQCQCESANNPPGDFEGCSSASGSGAFDASGALGDESGSGSGSASGDEDGSASASGASGSGSASSASGSGSAAGESGSGSASGASGSGMASGASGSGMASGASGSGMASGDESGSASASGDESGSGIGSASGWFSGWFSGSGSGLASGEESGSGSGALCETSGEFAAHNGGWNEGDYCFLLQIFISWLSELSSEDAIIFREFIDECQKTIILNGEYTDDERFEFLSFAILGFFNEHVTIKEAFQWKYIDFEGFQWGYVGFLEGAISDGIANASLWSISKEEVITVTDGECPLTKAADEWAGNDTGKQACAASFKSQVIAICSSSSSDEWKFSQLKAVFDSISVEYSQYSESFFSYQISGFSQIGIFSGFCTREWRAQHFELAVGGNASTCPLLTAIETIYEDTSYDVSFRSQVKQWHDSIEANFEETESIEERVAFFANVTYQYFLLNNWNQSIIFNLNITAEYGTIYDFISSWTAYASGEVTLTTPALSSVATSEASTSAASTTEAATTEAATTEAATTEAITTEAPTTAAPAGSCSSVYTTNTFSQNTTLLLTSITQAQQSWSNSYVLQFKGYLKKLYNIASSGAGDYSVFQQSKTVLVNFTTSTSTLYKMVHNITIQQWGGTIDQYCNCNPSA